jgi:hypothetical protein
VKTTQLEAAFLATTYRVETPGARFDLRIGLPDQAFEAFLNQQGASSWGIVTACNPFGEPTLEENAQRHAALLARITALGLRYFSASNHADSGKWAVEPGFCVLDASEDELCRLAAGFGQAAIVFGQVGQGGGQLVWLASQ